MISKSYGDFFPLNRIKQLVFVMDTQYFLGGGNFMLYISHVTVTHKQIFDLKYFCNLRVQPEAIFWELRYSKHKQGVMCLVDRRF
jgi:hypothetical protein